MTDVCDIQKKEITDKTTEQIIDKTTEQIIDKTTEQIIDKTTLELITDKLTDKKKDKLICPITLEPIVNAGCTCYGSVYELSIITEWLKTHNTDPLTNMMLPSLHITDLGSSKYRKPKQIRRLAETVAQLTNKFLKSNKTDNMFYFHHTPIFYAELLKQNECIKQLDQQLWINYCKTKLDSFINSYKMIYSSNVFKHKDEARPDNTGFNYQFMNLSDTNVKKRCLKSDRFDFTNFTNSVFRDCDFSRCTFIGANLTDTVFINCRFIGEQVSFYKAVGNPMFISCQIELVNQWVTVTSKSDVKKCLISRGLECDFTVQK